jgi:mRNA interferase MazF
VIHQGEIFWLNFGTATGSGPAGRRPALVVQSDRLNRTSIATTVVAVITSNLQLAQAIGNVRLRKGEGGLPRPSVVNVSQIRTIDKGGLGERVGRLSRERVRQVLAGLDVVFEIAD